MDKELDKSIAGYYLSLVKINGKWNELVKSCEQALNSLKNQTEQLRLVSDDSMDKEENDLVLVNDLRAKLVFKINLVIEDEIFLIFEVISQLNNLNQELKNKLTRLEKSRSKVDLNDEDIREFVIGTPRRPRLNLLMEWAIESSMYYDELYNSINCSMKKLDCRNEESVMNFIKSFEQDKTKRAEIERILGFTQFVAGANFQ